MAKKKLRKAKLLVGTKTLKLAGNLNPTAGQC